MAVTGKGAAPFASRRVSTPGLYSAGAPNAAGHEVLRDFLFAAHATAPVSAYQVAVASDGPSVWWRAEESSGPLVDDVAGIACTPSGFVTHQEAGLGSGSTGTFSVLIENFALSYLETPSNYRFHPRALTVETLIQSDGINGNNRIVQYGQDDSWRLLYEGGALRFTVFGLGEASFAWAGDTAVHHVAGTWDGAGTTLLYLDGTQVGQEAGAGIGPPQTSVGTLRIGGKPGSSTAADGWNGRIDEVAIYPAALTAGQVLAHAQAAGVVSVSSLRPVPVVRSQAVSRAGSW